MYVTFETQLIDGPNRMEFYIRFKLENSFFFNINIFLNFDKIPQKILIL